MFRYGYKNGKYNQFTISTARQSNTWILANRCLQLTSNLWTEWLYDSCYKIKVNFIFNRIFNWQVVKTKTFKTNSENFIIFNNLFAKSISTSNLLQTDEIIPQYLKFISSFQVLQLHLRSSWSRSSAMKILSFGKKLNNSVRIRKESAKMQLIFTRVS